MTVHFAGRLLWPYEATYYFNRHDSWVERLKSPPQIVFIGSSTVMYGISPSAVQKNLDLPEGSVINLGFEARSTSISDALWDRESRVLNNSKIVIYGLDPWILSEVYYNSDYFAILHFSLWQNFYQAIHPSDLTHLNLSAFGGPSFLHVIHGILSYHAKAAQPIAGIPSDYGSAILQYKPFNYTAPPRGYFDPYPTYGFSEIYLKQFAELKNRVEASGATFLLLLPPKRARWSMGYRNDCKDIDSDLVLKLNRYLGPTRIFGSFDLVPDSMQTQYFQDDFHLGETGQRFFSEWIAAHLNEAMQKTPQQLRSLSSY